LIDRSVGDCLNGSSLHNYGGARAYNRLARRSCLFVTFPGRPCRCFGMAGSLPNGVQVLGGSKTHRVFRKCGMGRCCPGSETTSESSADRGTPARSGAARCRGGAAPSRLSVSLASARPAAVQSGSRWMRGRTSSSDVPSHGGRCSFATNLPRARGVDRVRQLVPRRPTHEEAGSGRCAPGAASFTRGLRVPDEWRRPKPVEGLCCRTLGHCHRPRFGRCPATLPEGSRP